MYWEHFGFTEPPFALTPNPDFLFLSTHHQEAFAHLLFAIDTRAGFIELSGEVGTGKTTIIRTILNQLDPETHRTALIFNPTISPLGLHQEINREYGLPCTSSDVRELHISLNEFLLEQNRAGRTVVLVIDEAQNLSTDVLEQVRLISNLETERDKLIQIVLVGQPELQTILARQDLRQLNQRITVRYHLKPMEFDDVHDYIRHRVKIAAGGGEPVSFAPGAVRRIARFSGGLPRLVNAVCDRALLLAYTMETRDISPAMAARSIRDVGREERRPAFRVSRVMYAVFVVLLLTAAGMALLVQSTVATRERTVKLAITPAERPVAVQEEVVDGVKVLQQLLKGTGHYNGALTGTFDSATESAVRDFQKAERLKVDGKPGGKTLARLYQLAGGTFTSVSSAVRERGIEGAGVGGAPGSTDARRSP
ncbi:ExeA family protein [Geomobilimonas luticola]|uniref:AAA family ATPase n=1 Tax=Geomobilimonas luticola TaxID=1114878 RepID=A0ABS5SGC0_9BACT|nr:ExeA family protein [Geomobilimonas luticola]MBT0654403.1 AAA family ATPase [Geomobilimonas luticola]